MHRPILYLLLLINLPLFGQETLIDSLKSEISRNEKGTEQHFRILAQLSEAYVQINHDSMLHYAQVLLPLAEKAEDHYYYLYALQRVGVYHYVNHNFDSANVIFQKGYELSKQYELREREASYLGSIGINQYAQGNTDSGVAALKSALIIDQELNDTLKLFARYNNLGAIYNAIGQEAKALVYLIKALDMAESFHSDQRVYAMANNIAVIFNQSGNPERSLKYFNIALQNVGDQRIPKIDLLLNIANLYLDLDSLQKAAALYRKAYALTEGGLPCARLGILIGQMDLNTRRAKLDSTSALQDKARQVLEECGDSTRYYQFYFESARLADVQNDRQEAEKYYELARAFGSIKNRNFNRVFLNLSRIAKNKGDFKGALALYEEYNRLLNIQLRTEYAKDIAKLDLQHNYEKELQDLRVAQEKETDAIREDLQYSKDQGFFWTVVSALLLCLFLALVYFYQLRKRREKDLFDLNQIITKQKENLQSKSEQLVVSKKKIQELSEFRERLAAMAVHDMKGPLSTIIGLAEGEMSPRKQNLIKKAGSQMLQFLMDLLDIYKFEKAHIALKLLPHDISKLIREAWQGVLYLAEERAIRLSLVVPERFIVPVDEGILIRVLTNLISNALKYSPENGELTIGLKKLEQKGISIIQISITDKGPGISPEKIQHIFDPMDRRKETYISKSTSTGIGLDFCKLALQAHHGRIWAQSTLGKGTTVFIELPLLKGESLEKEVLMIKKAPQSKLLELEPYLNQLMDFKIHEAGKILKLLGLMEEDGLDPDWIGQLRATVYAADSERYLQILNKQKGHGV